MTRADTAFGVIVFTLVPLAHLPLSFRRILLVVSPPVYREPPGVSAVENLILPKACNCSHIFPIGYQRVLCEQIFPIGYQRVLS
jgi:hypothetical protein